MKCNRTYHDFLVMGLLRAISEEKSVLSTWQAHLECTPDVCCTWCDVWIEKSSVDCGCRMNMEDRDDGTNADISSLAGSALPEDCTRRTLAVADRRCPTPSEWRMRSCLLGNPVSGGKFKMITPFLRSIFRLRKVVQTCCLSIFNFSVNASKCVDFRGSVTNPAGGVHFVI